MRQVVEKPPPGVKARHSHEVHDGVREMAVFGDAMLDASKVLLRFMGDGVFLPAGKRPAFLELASALVGCGGVDDVTALQTNDVGDILASLGIEAARASIMKQILELFDPGSVNVRHVMLLVDNMTLSGTVKGVKIQGMGHQTSSVLGRACFERATEAFVQGAVQGKTEVPGNVSAAIVTGRPIPIGTTFSSTALVMDEDALPDDEPIEYVPEADSFDMPFQHTWDGPVPSSPLATYDPLDDDDGVQGYVPYYDPLEEEQEIKRARVSA
jgi:hypothetical protein